MRLISKKKILCLSLGFYIESKEYSKKQNRRIKYNKKEATHQEIAGKLNKERKSKSHLVLQHLKTGTQFSYLLRRLLFRRKIITAIGSS